MSDTPTEHAVKFQVKGLKAGFGDNDMICHLIIDPGDTKWEQTCPGALYVALSRAKNYGDLHIRDRLPAGLCYLLDW